MLKIIAIRSKMYTEKWFNLDSAEYVETDLHIWTLYHSLKKA